MASVSVTWLSSRWWLAACNWLMSTLSAVLSTMSHIQHVKNIWKYVSCTDCTDQGNDLFPTVKIKTRNHAEGHFGSEFPVICNHCGIMAAWSCKMFKTFEKILRIFGQNHPLWRNFYNSVLKVFIVTPINVLCSNFVKFGQGEISEIMHCVTCLPSSPAAVDSVRGQPRTMYFNCSRFHRNRLTFGGVIAKRVNTPKRAVKWIHYSAVTS